MSNAIDVTKCSIAGRWISDVADDQLNVSRERPSKVAVDLVLETVQDYHVISTAEETRYEMGADEAGAPGYQCSHSHILLESRETATTNSRVARSADLRV